MLEKVSFANTFVFLCVGDIGQATMLSSSIRKNSPSSKIIQCSDFATQKVPAVDYVERFNFDASNLMTFRLNAFSQLHMEYPAAYIDTDMLLINDFSIADLIQQHDGVVCRREFGCNDMINTKFFGLDMQEYEGKTFGEIYPYLACFTVTKNFIFWEECKHILDSIDTKFHKWYGDQEAIREIVNLNPERFGTAEESIYACLPERSEFRKSARLIHYKGPKRKNLMHEDFLQLINHVK